MKILRNGIWTEIETGKAAREKAAAERKEQEPARRAAKAREIQQKIRSEVVGHLLNRAVSKVIRDGMSGEALNTAIRDLTKIAKLDR